MNTTIQNVMTQTTHPKPIAAALHQTANHIGKAQRRVTKIKANLTEQREAWATYTSWIVKYHQEQSAEYRTNFTNTKAELREALLALRKVSQHVATLGAAATASAPSMQEASQDSEEDAELQSKLNAFLTVPRAPAPAGPVDQDAISIDDDESAEEGNSDGEAAEEQEEPEDAIPVEEEVEVEVQAAVPEEKPPPSYAAACARGTASSPSAAARQPIKITSKLQQTSPARQAASHAKTARLQKLDSARTAESLFQPEAKPNLR